MLTLIRLKGSILSVNQGNRMVIAETPNLTTLNNKGSKDPIRLGMLPTAMGPHHVVTEVDEEVGEAVLVILLLECWLEERLEEVWDSLKMFLSTYIY